LAFELLLTAPATITGLAPGWVAGATLTVKLTQDGTGGWPVTWGSAFKFAPQIVVTDANTTNIAMFFGAASGLWELSAAPILGVGI
jgi:hypothetical protein